MNPNRTPSNPLLRVCALMASLAYGLTGQVDRATLTGAVLDASGSYVPAATVEVKSEQTGLTRTANTDDNGNYRIPGLPVGRYFVSVSQPGFKTVHIRDVVLQVGQTRTLDVKLEVASQAAVVEVQDSLVAVDRSSAQQGSVVTSSELRNIPLNGREWSSLMMLAPGAINTGDGNQKSIRFMGRSKDDNQWTFDGIDATGVKEPAHIIGLRTVISTEAIAEFKVASALYGADTGYGIGGHISLVSKSGTNNFHGSIFEFLRNDKLDARRFIDVSKPAFRMNQFGGSLGGPILKDRTFFYVNYEGLRQRLGQTFVGFVPSPEFRQRVIAASPALRSIMDAFPAGQAPTTNADIMEHRVLFKQTWDENSGMFRVDHRFSNRTTMYVRYNAAVGTISTPMSIFRIHRQENSLAAHNAVWQLQHVFSPSLVNEFKLGFNRSNNVRARVAYRESIAIPGFTGYPGSWTEYDPGQTYSVVDNLSWTRGRHTIKAGVEIRALHLNIAQTERYDLSYASRDDFVRNQLDRLASVGEFATRGVRTEIYMGYLQDEWRVKPNLTLNLGARYEFYVPLYEKYGRARIFAMECGGICPPGSDLYNPDYNNLAPRVSLAWSPAFLKGRTTIRVGGGIYNQQGQIDDLLGPIESETTRFTVTRRELPGLTWPFDPAVTAGLLLPDTPRAIQHSGRRDFDSYQYGISVVQELPLGMSGQVGYTANLGRHVLERTYVNVIDPATGRRPLPAFGQIDIKLDGSTTNFHGMQASLNRRFARGFMWTSNYMYGHAIDDGAVGSNEASYPMNVRCRSCERASSAQDIRHYFILSSVYQLPFGKGRQYLTSGLAAWLLGNWEVSGMFAARTGRPVTVSVSRSTGDLPDGNNLNQRPDLVPGVPVYPEKQTADNWINRAAFAAPAKGTWGNLGRNTLRGPGMNQLDLSVGRRQPVTETMAITFRAEFFNLFNRVQLGQPSSNISSPGSFGRITSPLNSGATGTGTARQIQFMLRLDY